jgi:flagellar hook-basal body complex protein FliE
LSARRAGARRHPGREATASVVAAVLHANQGGALDPGGSGIGGAETMAIDGVSAVGSIGKSLDVGASSGTAATSSTQGPSFMDMLGQVVSDGIGSMQAGESAAIQGLQGAMQPYKVVDAIMGAQRTLSSALAIRDKAVSAYQEISRMAI